MGILRSIPLSMPSVRRRGAYPYSEHRPPSGSIRRFHAATVFLHHRLTNTKTQPRPAARPLRGIEEIENGRQNFCRDAGTVILKTSPTRIADAAQAYAQSSAIPGLADCLLRIQQQLEKHLHKLMRVHFDQRNRGFEET